MLEEKKIQFEGRDFVYFQEGNYEKSAVLLHGYSFESKVWEQAGITALLSSLGYSSFALDIPGFPNSRNKQKMNEEHILSLIGELVSRLNRPVLLGASASGYLALKFAEQNSSMISAVIGVGPVRLNEIKTGLIKVPMLLIWGSLDNVSKPVKVKGARVEVIAGARHACYLDKPEEFKKLIADFLHSL
jgi:abhydrolase domain-containing protein 14